MDKNVIEGSASGASGPSAAKPSGLGRRVNDAFARWKLVFLSGEVSLRRVAGLDVPLRRRKLSGNRRLWKREVSRGHSSRMRRAGSSCRRVTRPAKSPKLAWGEGLNRNDKSDTVCSRRGYSPTGEARRGAKWYSRMRNSFKGLQSLGRIHCSATARQRFGTA